MNLIDDPWVPVVWLDGRRGLLGLDDLFAQAQQLRDLAVKPHERIALMRLLICITQAALDGPDDQEAWECCAPRIQESAHAYLQKWKAAFELFGDGARFLQVPNLKGKATNGPGTSATKLDLALATGNNATVFDNAGGSSRPLPPERLALCLLAFQCFSPGGRIGVAEWSGAETPGQGSSDHAPCTPSSMLHAFILGQHLLETIHLNLLDRIVVEDVYGPQRWGAPVWEVPVPSATAAPEIANANTTYLGRLVPLARAIRLDSSGAEVMLGNGLKYPIYPAFREASVTIVQRKEGPGVLPASLERAVWRELPAITVLHHATNTALSGPLSLQRLPTGQGARLWLGALVTDKAKIEDLVEAAYNLPASMFVDAGRQVYQAGVAHAEEAETALVKAVRTYSETLKVSPTYDKARRHFWTAVEQHVPTLLALTADPTQAAEMAKTSWGEVVRSAAVLAFEAACPHQTPRQIQAFALGRDQLFRRSNPKPKRAVGKPSLPN